MVIRYIYRAAKRPQLIEQKMMIFNSFTVANDYIFGAQWPNGGRVFLETNKITEGICLAPSGKFSQKKLWILFVFKTIL